MIEIYLQYLGDGGGLDRDALLLTLKYKSGGVLQVPTTAG